MHLLHSFIMAVAEAVTPVTPNLNREREAPGRYLKILVEMFINRRVAAIGD